MATGCVRDVAIGLYAGRETGEPALLRLMLPKLRAGDVAVMDRLGVRQLRTYQSQPDA